MEEADQFHALLREYFTTVDQTRRLALEHQMKPLFGDPKSITLARELLCSQDAAAGDNVQFFGAILLFELVTKRWEFLDSETLNCAAQIMGSCPLNSFPAFVSRKLAQSYAAIASHEWPDGLLPDYFSGVCNDCAVPLAGGARIVSAVSMIVADDQDVSFVRMTDEKRRNLRARLPVQQLTAALCDGLKKAAATQDESLTIELLGALSDLLTHCARAFQAVDGSVVATLLQALGYSAKIREATLSVMHDLTARQVPMAIQLARHTAPTALPVLLDLSMIVNESLDNDSADEVRAMSLEVAGQWVERAGDAMGGLHGFHEHLLQFTGPLILSQYTSNRTRLAICQVWMHTLRGRQLQVPEAVTRALLEALLQSVAAWGALENTEAEEEEAAQDMSRPSSQSHLSDLTETAHARVESLWTLQVGELISQSVKVHPCLLGHAISQLQLLCQQAMTDNRHDSAAALIQLLPSWEGVLMEDGSSSPTDDSHHQSAEMSSHIISCLSLCWSAAAAGSESPNKWPLAIAAAATLGLLSPSLGRLLLVSPSSCQSLVEPSFSALQAWLNTWHSLVGMKFQMGGDHLQVRRAIRGCTTMVETTRSFVPYLTQEGEASTLIQQVAEALFGAVRVVASLGKATLASRPPANYPWLEPSSLWLAVCHSCAVFLSAGISLSSAKNDSNCGQTLGELSLLFPFALDVLLGPPLATVSTNAEVRLSLLQGLQPACLQLAEQLPAMRQYALIDGGECFLGVMHGLTRLASAGDDRLYATLITIPVNVMTSPLGVADRDAEALTQCCLLLAALVEHGKKKKDPGDESGQNALQWAMRLPDSSYGHLLQREDVLKSFAELCAVCLACRWNEMVSDRPNEGTVFLSLLHTCLETAVSAEQAGSLKAIADAISHLHRLRRVFARPEAYNATSAMTNVLCQAVLGKRSRRAALVGARPAALGTLFAIHVSRTEDSLVTAWLQQQACNHLPPPLLQHYLQSLAKERHNEDEFAKLLAAYFNDYSYYTQDF